MSYRDTVVGTWNENVLFTALVELTYRCNLDCFFCYNDLGLTGRPMGLEDYARFFEDLSALSCLHLTLTGGEPLAHPNFFAIGARARELGFVVRVKSNGHGVRGATLERLTREVDPFVVELSLHGGRAETHDRQTRVPGSFRRLLANLEEMRAAGLRVKLNATLTRWNEDEIESMYELADARGLPLAFDTDVTPRDDGDLSPRTIAASPEGLRRLHRVQTERGGGPFVEGTERQGELSAPDTRKHCGAGSSGIAVDPYANVYPCVQWRRPIGNLHDRSIRDIWLGSPELREIRALTERAKVMVEGQGELGKLLNFCPGAAEKETGDPLAVPEGLTRKARLFLELHPSQR